MQIPRFRTTDRCTWPSGPRAALLENRHAAVISAAIWSWEQLRELLSLSTAPRCVQKCNMKLRRTRKEPSVFSVWRCCYILWVSAYSQPHVLCSHGSIFLLVLSGQTMTFIWRGWHRLSLAPMVCTLMSTDAEAFIVTLDGYMKPSMHHRESLVNSAWQSQISFYSLQQWGQNQTVCSENPCSDFFLQHNS